MQVTNTNQPDKFYISLSKLTSFVAYVAVHLSPYDFPVGLETVCKTFTKELRKKNYQEIAKEFYSVEETVLRSDIREILFSIPEFTAWNVAERYKNNPEDQPSLQFTSAYEQKPNPTNDFVDLDGFMLEYFKILRAHDKDHI